MPAGISGKTKACLPSVTFPGDWDVTFSSNHWCNEITMEHYIQHICPYIQDTRKRLKLNVEYRALCIFDNFKAQRTDRILQLLEDNNIDTVFVPIACFFGTGDSAEESRLVVVLELDTDSEHFTRP